MEPISSRVQAGAAKLDEVRPGWAEAIDPGVLDLGMMEDCILGQLYGHYEDGCDALGIAAFGDPATTARAWGFIGHPGEHGWDFDARAEWLFQIRSRSAA